MTQAAFDAALALRDGRLDGHDADIFGGATNLVNAPAWPGNITWDLLAGTNQIRNLHATGPLSIALADNWTLSFACDSYSRGRRTLWWHRWPARCYWDQSEVSSFVAEELANYATSASVSSRLGTVEL